MESTVISCIVPKSCLMPMVVMMVGKKTQNKTRKGSLLKIVKVDGFSSSQPGFTCSKLTVKTLEQGVKYVQS